MCRVAQDGAKLVDGGVQVVIEGHKSIRPEFFMERFPFHDVPGVFDQGFQDSEGLLFEPNARVVLAKFARFERNLEVSEPRHGGCALGVPHFVCPEEFLASLP